MCANKSLPNAYSIIDSRLYMKSGNNRSKYDTVIKPLKIQGMSDFDVVNFSK